MIGWLSTGALYFVVSYVPPLDACQLNLGLISNCDWSTAGLVTFSSLFRVMWGVWVCWLIVACHAGWGGDYTIKALDSYTDYVIIALDLSVTHLTRVHLRVVYNAERD